MGGQQAGAEAAALAREALLGERDLLHAFLSANERIHPRGQEAEPDARAWAAWPPRCASAGPRPCVAHVGDTRVYLAGAAGCEQLTRDHTVAAHAQEQLGITDRGAKEIGGQNQVTRDLGGQPRTGDGLDRQLRGARWRRATSSSCAATGCTAPWSRRGCSAACARRGEQATPPDDLAEELVALALAGGTRDNSTVVVVRCLCPAPRESIWKKDILAWMKREAAS